VRLLAGLLLSLLALMPNSTSIDPPPQSQLPLRETNRKWQFLNPGVIEIHLDCQSIVIRFRHVRDEVWIWNVEIVQRAKCQPKPGDYPDEFLLPWT